jgi:glycosyltransferase involved in cell wall biosynthesis
VTSKSSSDRSSPSVVARERRAGMAPTISLVVPVYNEEESIRLFLDAVEAALPRRTYDLELVFVDDGSKDATLPALLVEAQHDQRIVVVELSRNFGKEAALTAGLDHATGEVVIPLDVDLQDPPELIPAMIERWREGFDVVIATRTSRDHDLFKNATAGGFYALQNSVSSLKIPANAGDFRLMDRSVVAALAQLKERNRFMKGIFAWTGFRTTIVPFVRPPRAAGVTKWNYVKLWNFALDGIVSFSTAPLKIWTYLGLVVAAAALGYAGYVAVRTMMLGVEVPGYASLLVVVLVLGAIQLISIGVLGEYVGRAFLETKQRPLYLVRSVQRAEPGASGVKATRRPARGRA